MSAIFAVTLPFFALVLCGYFALHWRLLPEASIPGLNAFVLFFALPCMLLRFGENTPIGELLDPAVLLVYTAAALSIVAVTVRCTRSPRLGLKDAAFGAFVAAFPNTGFMGVPLIVALLGADAAGPVITSLLVDLFVTSSLCLALARSADAGGGFSVRAALIALRGALSNPLPWSIALGALLSAFGLQLPAPLQAMARMLGDAASPVALFTIGAVLWRARQHGHSRSAPSAYLPIAAVKLLLHPALVYGLGLLVRRAGLPLGDFQLTVLTLAAALPAASSVSLLAERAGADNGRVAHIVLASTALAFFSFSSLAWWLT